MASNLEQDIDGLCDVFLKIQEETYDSSIQSFEHHANQYRKKFHEDMGLFVERFQKGYDTILEEIKHRRERKQTDMPLTAFQITDKKRARIQDDEEYAKRLKDGETMQEMLGISPRAMMVAYEIISDMYAERRYEDCINAFTYMTTLNPLVADSWLGLGASYQANHQFDEALLAYKLAMMRDPSALNTYICIGRVCIAMNRQNEAIDIFTKMIEVCESLKEHKKMRRIRKELKAMIKHLKKMK